MPADRPTSRLSRRTSQRAEVRCAQAARAEARRTAWRKPRSDEGFAMSSPLAMVAATVVAAAGVAFFATDGAREQQQVREAALVTAPAPVERPVTIKARKPKATPKPKPKPVVVQRSEVYAEVYNNSNITGLAGSASARMSGLGWQVVTTDNWYGTIPASTIYYPERLKAAAELLSADLGIARVQPAVDPMSYDRLTVVLTSDFG
jgi:hypothetical protein